MRAMWIGVFGVLITPDHAPSTDGSRGGADDAKGAGAAKKARLKTTPKMSASRGTRAERPTCIVDTPRGGMSPPPRRDSLHPPGRSNVKAVGPTGCAPAAGREGDRMG